MFRADHLGLYNHQGFIPGKALTISEGQLLPVPFRLGVAPCEISSTHISMSSFFLLEGEELLSLFPAMLRVVSREMAQQLRALTVLATDPALASSTHMAVHNCSVTPAPGDPTLLSLLAFSGTHVVHLNSGLHTYTYIFKK